MTSVNKPGNDNIVRLPRKKGIWMGINRGAARSHSTGAFSPECQVVKRMGPRPVHDHRID